MGRSFMLFNGKCLIGFAYQKNGDEWELRETKMDGRLMEFLGIELSRMQYTILPGIPSDRRPWIHLGFLLKILGNAKLDGGPLQEIYGLAGGRDTYTVVIEINDRLSSYRAG